MVHNDLQNLAKSGIIYVFLTHEFDLHLTTKLACQQALIIGSKSKAIFEQKAIMNKAIGEWSEGAWHKWASEASWWKWESLISRARPLTDLLHSLTHLSRLFSLTLLLLQCTRACSQATTKYYLAACAMPGGTPYEKVGDAGWLA